MELAHSENYGLNISRRGYKAKDDRRRKPARVPLQPAPKIKFPTSAFPVIKFYDNVSPITRSGNQFERRKQPHTYLADVR